VWQKDVDISPVGLGTKNDCAGETSRDLPDRPTTVPYCTDVSSLILTLLPILFVSGQNCSFQDNIFFRGGK
jgi:hypothetical protein